MPDWQQISDQTRAACGSVIDPGSARSASGGCISQAYIVDHAAGRFFVKLNGRETLPMFEAEAEGLDEIRNSQTLRAPQPICTGLAGSQAFLVMEYLPLSGTGSPQALAAALAAMHRVHHSQYGWHRDNTIGATPQPNPYDNNWLDFWRQHRLGFQLKLARQRGAGQRLMQRGERLMQSLEGLFHDYQPRPSLLHGDLWSGNYGFLDNGEPVVFDPAVYYGDREADLAMTELFGGFPAEFYRAYEEAYPLDSGYELRKILYNLYHILNHYNLFGGGYLSQAEHMLDRLLAELHA